MKLPTKLLNLFILSIVIIQLFTFFVVRPVAHAGLWEDIRGELEPIGTAYGVTGAPNDPRDIAMTVVNFALGFFSVIFLILIIYAGYLWMTARGNDDQIEKAKKIITRTVIGAAIVLAAWMITLFVISTLLSATNENLFRDRWRWF
ncbi:pilin [Patescibacteria group bacterium]|nr:pilin [Patescibacteria group bacterium]